MLAASFFTSGTIILAEMRSECNICACMYNIYAYALILNFCQKFQYIQRWCWCEFAQLNKLISERERAAPNYCTARPRAKISQTCANNERKRKKRASSVPPRQSGKSHYSLIRASERGALNTGIINFRSIKNLFGAAERERAALVHHSPSISICHYIAHNRVTTRAHAYTHIYVELETHATRATLARMYIYIYIESVIHNERW